MVRTAADRLRQGSRVTVRDLQKDWQFNGTSGRIEGRDGDRWAVKLDLDKGRSRVLRLLEANLQVVGLEETASLAKALTREEEEEYWQTYHRPPDGLIRSHHCDLAFKRTGRAEPALVDMVPLEYEKCRDDHPVWSAEEKSREWKIEALFADEGFACEYEPPTGRELDGKAPTAAKEARRVRRRKLERRLAEYLRQEQLWEAKQRVEAEAERVKADQQRARKAKNKADQCARDKEAHAHFQRITVHLGFATHAPNVGVDIREELRAIQRRDERESRKRGRHAGRLCLSRVRRPRLRGLRGGV